MEVLFARAWSGCSQQHIPSCKGVFHDISSATVHRGHAAAELFTCYTSLLHPRSIGICTALQQVARAVGTGTDSCLSGLPEERKEAGVVSISVATSALRFLYRVTLKKNWCMADMIPAPKVPKKLPIILSPEEVVRFLDCVAMRKHRAVLTTCYAAGLRISEAVALTLPAIDSQRMVLLVEQGKGQKDRYVMLSPKLLEILRDWWRMERPGHWLFPGGTPGQHITTTSVAQMCRKARRLSKIPKPITPHSMRHAFACHLLEAGTDIRQIQLLLGHRSLETTAKYLRIATSKVCSTSSPLDLLPRFAPLEVPTPQQD